MDKVEWTRIAIPTIPDGPISHPSLAEWTSGISGMDTHRNTNDSGWTSGMDTHRNSGMDTHRNTNDSERNGQAEWTRISGMDMHRNTNDSGWTDQSSIPKRNGQSGMDKAEWKAEWTRIAIPTIPDGPISHPSLTLFLQNGSRHRSMFGLGESTSRLVVRFTNNVAVTADFL
jgi:hypothetical protein